MLESDWLKQIAELQAQNSELLAENEKPWLLPWLEVCAGSACNHPDISKVTMLNNDRLEPVR